MKSLLLITVFYASAVFALGSLDLNSASQAELEALPGVGKKLAGEIVNSRPFSSVEDLKNVKGVGEAKYSKLKDLVRVGSSAPAAAPQAQIPAPVTLPSAKPSLPSTAQPESLRASAKSKLAPGTRINLNTASAEELEKLPGIGKKKAEAIISARPFSSPEDVMKVKGIKGGLFAKIKDFVTTN